MEGVKVVNFDNGFELRYLRKPFSTARGSLVARVGCANETPEERGISHFVEHTVFRGGTSKMTPEQSDLMSSRLGNANAFTNTSQTTYDGIFWPHDLDTFLQYVSSISIDAQFDPQVVEEERRGILAEIGKERNHPQSHLIDAFMKFFYQTSPLRRHSTLEILGPEEHIRRFTRDDLKDYHRRWTTRDNSTLFLLGPLPDDIEERVADYFGAEDGKSPSFKYQAEPHLTEVRRGSIERQGAERTSIIMAWQVPSHDNPVDAAKQSLMSYVMAGDFTHGLLRELRVNRGLVYAVNAEYFSDFGEGLFFVQTDTEPGKEEEVEGAVLEMVERFQDGEIDCGAFARMQSTYAMNVTDKLDVPKFLLASMRSTKRNGISTQQELELVTGASVRDIQEAANHLDRSRYAIFQETPA